MHIFTSSKSSEQLQLVSALSYSVSYPSPGYDYGLFYYGPIVDGNFIRALPSQEFKAGHFYNVPLLVDRDAYEGVLFTDPQLTSQVDETSNAQNLFPSASPSFFTRLYGLYPRSAFNSTFYRRAAWFGDAIINCPTHYMANAFTDHSSASSASAVPVFKMVFAAGSQLHGATGIFLSSSAIGFPAATNQTLAEIMSSYWISFTVRGDPNALRSGKAAPWPAYGAGGRGGVETGEAVGFSVLEVADADLRVGVDGDMGPRCDFFASQGIVLSN